MYLWSNCSTALTVNPVFISAPKSGGDRVDFTIYNGDAVPHNVSIRWRDNSPNIPRVLETIALGAGLTVIRSYGVGTPYPYPSYMDALFDNNPGGWQWDIQVMQTVT